MKFTAGQICEMLKQRIRNNTNYEVYYCYKHMQEEYIFSVNKLVFSISNTEFYKSKYIDNLYVLIMEALNKTKEAE